MAANVDASISLQDIPSSGVVFAVAASVSDADLSAGSLLGGEAASQSLFCVRLDRGSQGRLRRRGTGITTDAHAFFSLKE